MQMHHLHLIPGTPPLEACTRLYIQGPYGTGKTGMALQRLNWLMGHISSGGMPPTVIVPSHYIQQEYQRRLLPFPSRTGVPVRILTFNALARQAVELAWPEIAQPSGYQELGQEPIFLNLETSQYVLSDWVFEMVRYGKFEALSQNLHFEPSRLISQILDNLSKSSLYQYTLEEAYGRLMTALPASNNRQGLVNSYRNALQVSQRFRQHCLENSLVDQSLLYELFYQILGSEALFSQLLAEPCRHLIVDNCEEHVFACHRLLQTLIPSTDSCLCLSDSEAGLRYFLGAYPEGVATVAQLCQHRYALIRHPESGRVRLEKSIGQIIVPRPLYAIPEIHCEHTAHVYRHAPLDLTSGFPDTFLDITLREHYAETLSWIADRTQDLIQNGNVPPSQIILLAPNVSNALRFTLQQLLRQRGIDLYSHRPSRKLEEEPAAVALLGFACLAHPHWDRPLDEIQRRIALLMSIEGLEGWRGPLLSKDWGQRKYLRFLEKTQSFRDRVEQANGLRYDLLRDWLRSYQQEEQHSSLDLFLARLYDELLGKKGFRFARDADASRVVRQLIRSAQSYRQITEAFGIPMESLAISHDPGQDYVDLVRAGLIGNLFLPQEGPPEDAVELAPVHSFIMQNRTVQHQFWLDVNSPSWGQRLHQPLTQPFVLAPSWPGGEWTDLEEQRVLHWYLHILILGLLRRTRNQVHIALSTFGPKGTEQKGTLLRVLNQLYMQASNFRKLPQLK